MDIILDRSSCFYIVLGLNQLLLAELSEAPCFCTTWAVDCVLCRILTSFTFPPLLFFNSYRPCDSSLPFTQCNKWWKQNKLGLFVGVKMRVVVWVASVWIEVMQRWLEGRGASNKPIAAERSPFVSLEFMWWAHCRHYGYEGTCLWLWVERTCVKMRGWHFWNVHSLAFTYTSYYRRSF